jgi:hypothetical protein
VRLSAESRYESLFMNRDEEQLKLLAIFHYVVAGIAALCAVVPVIHLCLGLFMVFGAHHFAGSGQMPPPAFVGWIFIIVATVIIVLGLTVAGFILTAGCFLARRKHHTFCLVVAGAECLFMPFGTVLGIFTILVLNRDSVKQLFTIKSNSA